MHKQAKELLTNAQRMSLHEITLDVLDSAEELHRWLGRIDSATVGLSIEDFRECQDLARTAYESLAKMRQITEHER